MGRAIELHSNFCGTIKMEQAAQWHLAVRVRVTYRPAAASGG
jgi:hypothetical protein